MNLFDEFFTVTRELNAGNIPYAVVGGIAMAFHDQPRFTKDIDILILPDSADQTRAIVEKIGYVESSTPWTFKDTKLTLHRFIRTEEEEFNVVDLLIGDEPHYRQIVENAVKDASEAGTVSLARKEDLIWMKQGRNSDQDRVDIGRLQNDKD